MVTGNKKISIHAPCQCPRTIGLAFHQQAADELGGNQLSGTAEERLGKGWEFLDGRGGYGSGLGDGFCEKVLRVGDETIQLIIGSTTDNENMVEC